MSMCLACCGKHVWVLLKRNNALLRGIFPDSTYYLCVVDRGFWVYYGLVVGAAEGCGKLSVMPFPRSSLTGVGLSVVGRMAGDAVFSAVVGRVSRFAHACASLAYPSEHFVDCSQHYQSSYINLPRGIDNQSEMA